MALGIIGRKVGMTRIFDDAGRSTPVTVVEVEPNYVTQVKGLDRDGYCAVQVTVGSRRPGRVSQALRAITRPRTLSLAVGCGSFE